MDGEPDTLCLANFRLSRWDERRRQNHFAMDDGGRSLLLPLRLGRGLPHWFLAMNTDEAIAPSPTPEESGAELVQKKPAQSETVLAVQISRSGEGIQQDSLSETLKEIMSQGMRSPTSTIHLLIFQIKNLESRLQREEEERKTIQTKLDGLRDDNHKKCLECEVLKVELRTMAKIKILQQCLLTVGAIGMGLSLKSIGDPPNKLAIGVAIICGVLLFAGWLWPIGFKEKEQK